MAGRKLQIGNLSLVHREKGLFFSVYVDDKKIDTYEGATS